METLFPDFAKQNQEKESPSKFNLARSTEKRLFLNLGLFIPPGLRGINA
jgi:hypothetical protein